MHHHPQKRVAVVGAGIIGLTSGIELLESGANVAVFAKALSPDTTSDVAAALWHPGGVITERMKTWCQASLRVFKELAKDEASGIKFVRLYELSDQPFKGEGLKLADDLQPVDGNLFPKPYSYGFRFLTARLDVPRYMPYLVERFKRLGGVFQHRTIHHLKELSQDYTVIINATGVGAKELAPDTSVYPIRGQVIRVAKPEGLKDDIIHVHTATTFTYIVPRENDCILGGTYQVNDANLEPHLDIATAILERTSMFNPAFKQPKIVEHKVGLRPGRPEVRLEPEPLNSAVVIHNYGHGSIGHTLSWGCAKDVTKLAKPFLFSDSK